MSGNRNRQLREAAQEGDLKKVRSLLSEGADINAQSRADGNTPLLLAIEEGHRDIWRHLLDAGARVDVATELGSTAMHVAAGAGDIDALEALFKRRLSIDGKDRFGKTPLMEAAVQSPTETVEWLLDHGADPNATDKEGCTALHAAYIGILMCDGEGEEEGQRTVALLEKHGADPNLQDKMGRKPKDLLKQRDEDDDDDCVEPSHARHAPAANDEPLAPADRELVELLENVGIQVSPAKKTDNSYFNEIKCGIPRKLQEQVNCFEKGFPTLGSDCRSDECIEKAFCWQVHISGCTGMIHWRHFGFRGKLNPQQILDKGIEMAQNYFKVVADRLAKARPKMHWTKEVAWYQPYSQALLLATLAGRPRERTRLSDYLHPKLVVETVAIPIEPVLGDVLLCIAAPLQTKPMDSAPLQERLQKSRKKRPKLLFKAWQALETGDRAKFASALADSMANFTKTTAAADRPSTAIALEESILAALAYERGWTDLTFELPIAARLVTHQSLELG
jgi:hypothetical protein